MELIDTVVASLMTTGVPDLHLVPVGYLRNVDLGN